MTAISRNITIYCMKWHRAFVKKWLQNTGNTVFSRTDEGLVRRYAIKSTHFDSAAILQIEIHYIEIF